MFVIRERLYAHPVYRNTQKQMEGTVMCRRLNRW